MMRNRTGNVKLFWAIFPDPAASGADLLGKLHDQPARTSIHYRGLPGGDHHLLIIVTSFLDADAYLEEQEQNSKS